MPDEVHDGRPEVDDEVAFPGLEQLLPVPNLLEPTERSQSLAGTIYIIQGDKLYMAVFFW